MGRVAESTIGGLIIAAVVGVIAWRVNADPVLVSGIGFLIGFAGLVSKGRTSQSVRRPVRRRSRRG